jgi:pilus assembly protein CpaB
MNRRLLVILLSAFVLAAGSSYLVFRLVGKRLTAPHQTTTRVVAAAKDIKLGTILRDADLTTIDIAGTPPKGVLLKPADAIGRGVIADLYQGEPILDNRLAPVGSGGGLAATIPQGMRACAVRVNDVVGVAGFATPGLRVDVLISGNPPGTDPAKEGSKVATLLQNIEVLSAGTDIQKDAEGKPRRVEVVNLLVTPEQAELLSLASNETRIQLVLRNPLDTQMAQTTVSSTALLFNGNTAAPVKTHTGGKVRRAPQRAGQVYLIEVFNGSKRNQEKFVSGGEKQ